jgi:hypothetical protein
MAMKVLESFMEGKRGRPDESEDAIVVTDDFVFVIDGATDKTGIQVDGVTTGSFASCQIAQAVQWLPPQADATECVMLLTEAVDRTLMKELSAPPDDRPSGVFVAYSRARREIWRVGDCSFSMGGMVRLGRKRIDETASSARGAYLRSLLLAGASVEDLLENDPGRQLILPLLRQQFVFRNRSAERRFGYGAVDGTPVPRRFIEVHRVLSDARIVLATDGYARLFPSLEETERYWARDIAQDPLRIESHPSTKGVHPGDVSFDDRAFVLLEP